MKLKNYCLSLVILGIVSTSALAQKTAIVCKRLIDGTGKVIQNAAIVMEADRIISVGNKDIIPKDAVITDLGDYTVLPGLIDAHVHPFIDKDDYQVDHLRKTSAQKALEGLKHMQDLLLAGWTTLRIAGDADVAYAQFDIRNAINKGLFIGPHIFGAGHYISVTGGGGDINFMSYEQPIIADGLVANGPEEMRKAVREEIQHGSDWIKILVTGAFMTVGDNPQDVHFSSDELQAVMDEANRRHKPVMAHAHATDGIKMAVRSIEHGSYLDEEGIDLMLKHGTYLVPTMAVGLFFQERYFNSKALAKAVQLGKHDNDENTKHKMLALAIKKGVKVALGTDNIGFPPTFPAREFAELVKLGMTPMQAIQAGTKVNAEMLGKADLGTLEVGKLADLMISWHFPRRTITKFTINTGYYKIPTKAVFAKFFC